MTPIEKVVDALEAHDCRPKTRGASTYARCPVHGGSDFDSLSLTEGGDGRVLMTCHSKGCRFADIMGAIGLEAADAFPPERVTEFRGSRIVMRSPPQDRDELGEPEAIYDYHDPDGGLLFQVLRYRTERGKTFRQRRPDGDGWLWTLGDVERVLYRLPAVQNAIEKGEPVFVVEGEKDVHAIEGLGLTATCSLGGACEKPQAWSDSWSETLRNGNIVILPDNDEPGRKHADVVRNAVVHTAESVRIVELPDLPPKGDAFDWVEAGGTAEELLRLSLKTRLNPFEYGEFMECEFDPGKELIGPWLHERHLNMVFAKAGVGKTQFLLAMACALTTGKPFLGWEVPGPVGVLYVDGEMPGNTLQERLARIAIGFGVDPVAPFTILTPDLNRDIGGIRSLRTNEGQADLLEIIRPEHKVIILDNLACLYGGMENDADEWDMMQSFLLNLRGRGHSVMFAHHTTKGGEQRGTSHREDVLDNSISLRRPGDYKPDDGARFSVVFTKARNVEGGALKIIEAQLRDAQEGRGLIFTTQLADTVIDEQILKLLIETTMTQTAIATEVGCDQSTVSRAEKRARSMGLITGPRKTQK